jgi:hypothetical protein
MLRKRGSISAFDLVLDRGDRLGAEARIVAGIFAEPEGAHVRISDMLLDERHAERLVDQQAGEHQQRAAGHVEQGTYRIGQDVVEPRPPTVGPDMPECGDDPIGDDRLQLLGDGGEGIEADRPLAVGRVYIDQIVGAASRHVEQHGFSEIAMRIEQSEPSAGDEVLRDQV